MIGFLSYLFYFVAASVSPLQRRWLATKKNVENKGQISFAFQVTLIVSCLSLLIPIFSPFYIKGNIFYLVGLALVYGLFGGGFYIASYIAQKYVEAGTSVIVSNIYTPTTIVLATIFLNEGLTIKQILGTILLLIGMVVVSKKIE